MILTSHKWMLLEISQSNIAKITEKIKVQAHWDFDYYTRMAEEIRTRLSKYFGDNRFPILPQRAVRAIRKH